MDLTETEYEAVEFIERLRIESSEIGNETLSSIEGSSVTSWVTSSFHGLLWTMDLVKSEVD